MAKICIALVAALAVAVVADPIRRRRSDQLIATQGAAAGWAAGSAGDQHAVAVNAQGIPASGWGSSSSGWGSDAGSGWAGGVPASISIATAGGSELANTADVSQLTSNDGVDLLGVQVVDAGNYAFAGDETDLVASGGDVSYASSDAAYAQGAGSIVAEGETVILADGASNLGMAQP